MIQMINQKDGKKVKILLTAFDPFGGDSVNPASEALNLINLEHEDLEIIKFIVPTVFYKSIDTVTEVIEKEQPDVVLCLGQAGGRKEITPERVAINLDDARICDNEGNQPIDTKIYEDGESAYFATIPIKAIVQKITEANLPSSVSNSAGTFVCNHLMYGVLYYISKHHYNMKAGFLHIPYMTKQVKDMEDKPALPLNQIVQGIELAIEAIACHKVDIITTGGTEC
jgi:pyroglutamyl-peptidase